MAIQGIKLLPPVVSINEALNIYKKVAIVKSNVGRLNAELSHSIVNSQLMQMLTLKESVQSTRIEGTQVTFADMIDNATKKNKSTEVIEVENYMRSLSHGVELIMLGEPITSKMIRELHTILMEDSRGTTSSKGEYRKIQNFIGPTKKMEDAVYIPIGANEIGNYMTNFEYYINSVDHISFSSADVGEHQVVLGFDSDPLIKTAIMHAQFESIHPFLDGNGRMGRILIVLCTMQDKLIETPVFFVSEELEKERIRYYNLLNGTRGSKPDWYSWIEFFLDACNRMALSMLEKLDSITNLAEEGLIAIDPKGNSTIERVWLSTFKKPFVTVQEIAENLSIATGTARSHLNKLVDLKLIDVDKSKTKNKLYVNYDLLRLL